MIFLSAGELWAAVIGLAAAMGAAWYLLGAAARWWRSTRAATAVLPTALPPLSPSARPLHGGITLHVLPCGCVYHYQRIQRDPCAPHAQLVAERDEINRLDQQIRQMP